MIKNWIENGADQSWRKSKYCPNFLRNFDPHNNSSHAGMFILVQVALYAIVAFLAQ